MSANDYVVEREFLYNNDGNHDKVYNVAIRTRGSKYEVVTEYGARTSVLKQQVKYSGPSLSAAREEYRKVIHEKTFTRGYRIVNADKSGRSTLITIPVSGQNKSAAELKKEADKLAAKKASEVYNPHAIPERRLDFDEL